MSTTITVKGLVTIPKSFRNYLGLKAGDRLDFADDDSVRAKSRREPPAASKKSWFATLVGARGTTGGPTG